MKFVKHFSVASLVILFISAFAAAQADTKRLAVPDHVRNSAAYAEVILRQTEILADLDAALLSYTEDHPKIIELRTELASINKSIEKLVATRASDAGKLTLALGKLAVRRASLESDYIRLSKSFSKDHPELLRAKRRLEIFDETVNDIIQ